MSIYGWITGNYIEAAGAIAGIVYVFLEIRQSVWLWPVGIITSAVYIWVFFASKLYADMSLQWYYLIISFLGWYWWSKGAGKKREGGNGRMGEGETRSETTQFRNAEMGEGETRSETTQFRNAERGDKELDEQSETIPEYGRIDEYPLNEKGSLIVTRLKVRVGIILAVVFIMLYLCMWVILTNYTDSPVAEWDAFITSLSIVATWMLARKIFEHWFLWIAVNMASVILFLTRGLYPTLILYFVYLVMSFVGLKEWKKTIQKGG